jgi:cytochrome c-type biogenesis protein CcmH/NrfF
MYLSAINAATFARPPFPRGDELQGDNGAWVARTNAFLNSSWVCALKLEKSGARKTLAVATQANFTSPVTRALRLSLPSSRLFRFFLLMFLLLPSDLLSQAMTPEVHQIGDRLACQCGSCNNQVSTCPMLNCHSATPLREEIAGMIKQGMNPEQIVKAFVAKYGKVILAAPPAEGFDMMAWTLPFIMLLLGFIVVYWLIKTWLNRKPLLAPSVGGPGTIPESYQERIDRELKDLDR